MQYKKLWFNRLFKGLRLASRSVYFDNESLRTPQLFIMPLLGVMLN